MRDSSGVEMTTKPLPCSCCPRPFAELIELNNGEWAVLVRSRHDSGDKHPNLLTPGKLQQLIDEAKAQKARHTPLRTGEADAG